MRYQSSNSNELRDKPAADWNGPKTIWYCDRHCPVSLFKHNLNKTLLPLTVISSVVLPPWTTSLPSKFGSRGVLSLVKMAVSFSFSLFFFFAWLIGVVCKRGKLKIHFFFSKEQCNDKCCQTLGLSGQGVVLAFSVINFSAVSRFLVATDQIALNAQQLHGWSWRLKDV